MKKIDFIKKNNLDDCDSKYRYYVELIEKTDDQILIRGWVVFFENKQVDVNLVDKNGITIEGSNVWRKTRKDVKKLFEINNDFKSEFLIKFKRDIVNEDNIYIRFVVGDEEERLKQNEMLIDVFLPGLDFSLTKCGRVVAFLTHKPFRRSIGFIKRNNQKELYRKVCGKLIGYSTDYDIWRKVNKISDKQLLEQRNHHFEYNPLISISIPLYNTPIDYFKDLMDSIINQTYSNFELCLADGSDNDKLEEIIKKNYPNDNRIVYKRLERNYGIAGNTNESLRMSSGEYVMLADHDDVLEVNALYEIVKILNENKEIDIIYTDEDLIDASGTIYSDYRFKPDFNLEMLRGLNYICHIFAVRKTIMLEVGGFREEYDGAQDFDMILRCCEKSDAIYHIPKVLYHWRAHDGSTAGNVDSKQYAIDASVKALEAHYNRVGIDAKVEDTDIFIMLRTIRNVIGCPLVSILIPNMEHIDDLDKCIRSIIEKSTYSNYEIIVIENNSKSEETFSYYEKIQEEFDCVKVCKWENDFNYSKINNFGSKVANGEYYILLNNDIEVISEDWIERMLSYCQDESVGAVGVKLLYPDDTVQHCGIVIGVGGFGGHILTNADVNDVGYFGRLRVQQEVSAVTAACMMVDAHVFEEINGFDEEFAVALNDVDLCLKIRDNGKKIILDPNVMMYHYESKSRGYEDSPEKIKRFKKEIKRFRSKWQKILKKGDPYYSPNLTLDRGDCTPRRVDERFLIIEEIEAECSEK